MTTPESLASDPNTDLGVLAQLAYDHPELQPQIARNPSTYPDLLDWIASYGTPAGIDAATGRIRSDAIPSVSEPEPELEAALESVSFDEASLGPESVDDSTLLSTARPSPWDETSLSSTTDAPLPPDAWAPFTTEDEPTDETVLVSGDESASQPFLTRSPTALPPPLSEVDAATSKKWAETRTAPMGAPAGPPHGATLANPVSDLAPPPGTQVPSLGPSTPLPPTGQPLGYSQAPPPLQARPHDISSEQLQQRQSSRSVVVLLGVLIGILAAMIVAGAVWFFVLREDSAGVEAQQTMAEADSAAVAEKALAEKEEADAARLEAERELAELQAETDANEQRAEEETVDNQIRYPAPATAVTAPWFLSPSGNIACELDSLGAKCTVYEADFSLSAPGCVAPPYTIVADSTSSRWDCSEGLVPNDTNGPVLEYSTSSTAANSACLSTTRGMTCWDTVSGSSFAIAQQGFMLSSNGLIPETEFPWR